MNSKEQASPSSGRKRSLDETQVNLCSQNFGSGENNYASGSGTSNQSNPPDQDIEMKMPSRRRGKNTKPHTTQLPSSTLKDSDGLHVPPPKSRTRLSLDGTIKKLRLEAIFHPKFENEKSDQAIRQCMIQNVSSSGGYLEATLKHSGSLLLWSGNQRFYSKNSTDNVFTGVGEILLRQHFARAWSESENGGDLCDEDPNSKFQECSDFIEEKFLTLSFEVVPSVLGHHGDIPHRDYMILIAVADRQKGTFYNTSELVSFAQKFRLPHNDSWVFNSKESAEKLFELYDTMRETGMASDVVGMLNGATDGGHVKSMYPHHIFQGEILEGIVIRYVPYSSIGQNDDEGVAEVGTKEQVLKKMRELCTQSEKVLKIVPPEKSSFSLGHRDTLLHTDLRKVYEEQDDESATFEERVKNILKDSHEKRKRVITRLNTRNSLCRVQDIDISKMASDLLSSANIDHETRQIATLIQTLGDLNIQVDYNLMREERTLDDGKSVERYLCIIHVRHDASFQKYNNATKLTEAMPLYRGFSIELIPQDTAHLYKDHTVPDVSVEKALKLVRLESNHGKVTTDSLREEKLMLKMKFLPYMVRTFICRNGLTVLTKSGVAGFEQYALSQLNRWNISVEVIEKWMPFFQGWALYCNSAPTATSSGKKLPVLTATNYLHHYNEYSDLFGSGQFQSLTSSSDQPKFRGLIVLVGIKIEELDPLANKMSTELGLSRIVRDINAMSECDMISSMHRSQGGIVCTANITDGVKNVRSFAKKFQNAIYIVMVGCSKDEIEASFIDSDAVGSSRKEVLKTIGMSNAWRKCKCNFVVEIPIYASSEDGILEDEDVISSALKRLKDSSDSFQTDTRPGMFLFFPAIPGSGKSALCRKLTADEVGIKSRKLIVREGDKTKGKFYPIVEEDMLKSPSSVFVADKNVPPASWPSVSNICSNHKATAVAVLPSSTEDYKIEFSHEDSTQVARSCVFPFTLHYLAVCMYRVMQRAPRSHNGKLDSATELACMVVVKFYCLYRNISNDKLLQNIHSMGKSQNDIIRVPFFGEGPLPALPADLKHSLDKAINLQVLADLNMLDFSDDAMKQMEEQLRSHIGRYADFLVGLTAPENESSQSFLTQFSKKVASHSDTYKERSEDILRVMAKSHKKETLDAKKIKIVSLDIPQTDVHGILDELAKENQSVQDFLNARASDRTINDDDDKDCNRFIRATHCTFAHCSGMTQADMYSIFGHLLGVQADIYATALLFNDTIAALEVSIPLMASNDPPSSIPRPCNKFPHITVWCGQNGKAWQSNLLPKQVEANQANAVKLKTPISLKGTFSFWYEK